MVDLLFSIVCILLLLTIFHLKLIYIQFLLEAHVLLCDVNLELNEVSVAVERVHRVIQEIHRHYVHLVLQLALIHEQIRLLRLQVVITRLGHEEGEPFGFTLGRLVCALLQLLVYVGGVAIALEDGVVPVGVLVELEEVDGARVGGAEEEGGVVAEGQRVLRRVLDASREGVQVLSLWHAIDTDHAALGGAGGHHVSIGADCHLEHWGLMTLNNVDVLLHTQVKDSDLPIAE